MTKVVGRASLVASAVAAAITVSISGCGGSDSANASDWQAIDPCSLADSAEVAEVDNSGTTDDVALPELSEDSRTCKWGDYLKVTVFGDAKPGSGPGMITAIRSFEIDGRTLDVTEERNGNCSVRVQYDNARIGVFISPYRSKTDIDFDDTSSASCDAQAELITSILGRVDLK